MKLRGAFSLVLIGILLALRPMAFASLPDPSWPAGFYDDSDFDDVIMLITGSIPAIACRAAHAVPPVFVVVVSVLVSDERAAPAPLIPSHDTRAPPAA